MSKKSCEAAESAESAVLRMARVNCAIPKFTLSAAAASALIHLPDGIHTPAIFLSSSSPHNSGIPASHLFSGKTISFSGMPSDLMT